MKKCEVKGCSNCANQVLTLPVVEEYQYLCDDHYLPMKLAVAKVLAKVTGMTDDQMERRLSELNNQKVIN